VRFDIPKMFYFHKDDVRGVEVDVWRVVPPPPQQQQQQQPPPPPPPPSPAPE
jgi:hypothetical protein